MVSRRGFLCLLGGSSGLPDTPRNKVAIVANDFQQTYQRWATAFNKITKDIIPADAYLIATELPEKWRRLEKQSREWARDQFLR